MSKRKNNSSNSLNLQNFIKSQIINLSVFILLFSASAFISVIADIGIGSTYYVSLAFITLSSFVCGAVAGLKERKKGMICGIFNVLPLNAIILIISLISNSFKADISFLITFLAGLLAGALGGIVAVNIRLK